MNSKAKGMTIKVKVQDMDIFKDSMELLKEIYQRKDVPEDIRDKIINFVSQKKTK